MRVFAPIVVAGTVSFSSVSAAAPSKKKLSCGGKCNGRSVTCEVVGGEEGETKDVSLQTLPPKDGKTFCVPVFSLTTTTTQSESGSDVAKAFFDEYELEKGSDAVGDWVFGDAFASGDLAKTFSNSLFYGTIEAGFDNAQKVWEKLNADKKDLKTYFAADALLGLSGTWLNGSGQMANVNADDMDNAVFANTEFAFFLVTDDWLTSTPAWTELGAAQAKRAAKSKTQLLFKSAAAKQHYDDSWAAEPKAGAATQTKQARDAVETALKVSQESADKWADAKSVCVESDTSADAADKCAQAFAKRIEDFIAANQDDEPCVTCCCVWVAVLIGVLVVSAIVLVCLSFRRGDEDEDYESSSSA